MLDIQLTNMKSSYVRGLSQVSRHLKVDGQCDSMSGCPVTKWMLCHFLAAIVLLFKIVNICL